MEVPKTDSPHILMVSAECYPAAKVGGLADVVGSLPRYLNKLDARCAVVMPHYHNAWITQQEVVEKHYGSFHMGWEWIEYRIFYIDNEDLGYDLYTIDIPGKFDRSGVYGDQHEPYYRDEIERNVAFQRAVLHWLIHWEKLPDLIHCHDHHTALIPFMMTRCPEFWRLGLTPTVLTIHNAAYQGMFGWDRQYLLPEFSREASGLLDWGHVINSLACGIKCAWRVTTVSENYLRELRETSGFGLQGLFHSEYWKSRGVINGIDYDYWNPADDRFLTHKLKKNIDKWKKDNKVSLLKELKMPTDLPLHIFIGRMVMDKGVDFLASLIYQYMIYRRDVCFIILGTGDGRLEDQCRMLEHNFGPHVRTLVMYNEGVAHRLYAAADFLWMPSRTEPCGLNQMYAMRYGTVPIARATGGLLDTIEPFDGNEGDGFLFRDLEEYQGMWGIESSSRLFSMPVLQSEVRGKIMSKDLSWDHSAAKYLNIYHEIIPAKSNA
ncbi:MAG TPA: glycogen/starch synthase [Saprospiraceae bacterium]|nr:glycogen/starch synthase [Saprospiraceae bacterium]